MVDVSIYTFFMVYLCVSVITSFLICKKLAVVLRCTHNVLLIPKYKLNYFVHINRQKLVFHFILFSSHYLSYVFVSECECVRCFDVIFLIASYT